MLVTITKIKFQIQFPAIVLLANCKMTIEVSQGGDKAKAVMIFISRVPCLWLKAWIKSLVEASFVVVKHTLKTGTERSNSRLNKEDRALQEKIAFV